MLGCEQGVPQPHGKTFLLRQEGFVARLPGSTLLFTSMSDTRPGIASRLLQSLCAAVAGTSGHSWWQSRVLGTEHQSNVR